MPRFDKAAVDAVLDTVPVLVGSLLIPIAALAFEATSSQIIPSKWVLVAMCYSASVFPIMSDESYKGLILGITAISGIAYGYADEGSIVVFMLYSFITILFSLFLHAFGSNHNQTAQ
ncbi:MAG: hypothetical protein AAGI52_10730 [Bacteroidota bacterium]